MFLIAIENYKGGHKTLPCSIPDVVMAASLDLFIYFYNYLLEAVRKKR